MERVEHMKMERGTLGRAKRGGSMEIKEWRDLRKGDQLKLRM